MSASAVGREDRLRRVNSPYIRGRNIQTTSANAPSPFLCLTRSYGFLTLSIVNTLVCKKAEISASTLLIPLAPSARREEIVGICKPVLVAFHVSETRSSDGDFASVAARSEGSVLRSGIEGCRTVLWAVKRSRIKRRTALVAEETELDISGVPQCMTNVKERLTLCPPNRSQLSTGLFRLCTSSLPFRQGAACR